MVTGDGGPTNEEGFCAVAHLRSDKDVTAALQLLAAYTGTWQETQSALQQSFARQSSDAEGELLCNCCKLQAAQSSPPLPMPLEHSLRAHDFVICSSLLHVVPG